MNVLLGADLGTSAYKAVAMATDGRILASSRVAAVYRRPAADRVQFSAPDQFRRLARLIRNVVDQLPREARPAALCLSSASGNTLLLDGRCRPLAPAISWLDTRAGETYRSLLPQFTPEEVRETVGWRWTPRFPLTQLAWLRRHRPAVYAKARHVATDTAYYHQQLTGRLAIDHSSATPFFLQDQKRRDWHHPFLDALAIQRAALPELLAPGAPLGRLTPAAARTLRLPVGLPVVAGSFDHPSAAMGAGVLRDTDLLLSCGTSWVGFLPVRDRAAALAGGFIVDPFLQPGGPWGAMFALTAVGTTIDRYLAGIFPLPKAMPLAERYEQFTAAAASVRSGDEGPPIDPMAPPPTKPADRRALCAGSSLGQLSRRLMVGTALATRRRLAALATAGFRPTRLVIVGGPSTSAVWTQIVSDVLGRELHLAGAAMAGARGAAMLGGVGVGIFPNVAEASKRAAPPMTIVKPDPTAVAWYGRCE